MFRVALDAMLKSPLLPQSCSLTGVGLFRVTRATWNGRDTPAHVALMVFGLAIVVAVEDATRIWGVPIAWANGPWSRYATKLFVAPQAAINAAMPLGVIANALWPEVFVEMDL